MKKLYLAAIIGCLAVFGTSCKKAEEQVPATVESEQTQPATTIPESVPETTPEETTTQAIVEKSLEGIVQKAEGSIIFLSADEEEYQIDIKDAKTPGDLDIGQGDKVSITFQDVPGEKVKPGVYFDILATAAALENQDPTVYGEIQQADDHKLVLKAADGTKHSFTLDIAQVVTGKDGLAPGESAEVTYLAGAEPEAVTALRVITDSGSGNAEATYKALVGTVASADEESLAIKAANGETFRFAVDGMVDASDFPEGEQVEVSYEGSIGKGTAVVEAIDYH